VIIRTFLAKGNNNRKLKILQENKTYYLIISLKFLLHLLKFAGYNVGLNAVCIDRGSVGFLQSHKEKRWAILQNRHLFFSSPPPQSSLPHHHRPFPPDSPPSLFSSSTS
jgi:hypothetical protein